MRTPSCLCDDFRFADSSSMSKRTRQSESYRFEGRLGEYYYSGDVTHIAPLGEKHFAANVTMIKWLARDRTAAEVVSTANLHEYWGKDEREAETKARREVEDWIRRRLSSELKTP